MAELVIKVKGHKSEGGRERWKKERERREYTPSHFKGKKQTLQTPLLLTSQITRTQSRDCTLPLGRQKFIVVCLAKTLGVLLLDKRREDV